MPGLWDELRRRKVVRVAIAYAAAGWFLIQVADIVLDNFEAPAWIFQTILLLLIIGFPAALILSWAFKLTPDGIRREEFERLPKQAAPIIAIISVTLIFGSAALWLRVDGLDPAPADARFEMTETRQSNPVVAVLPFSNLSDSAQNDYVADGMTEDVITLLAQSPNVDVIARNSTFQYKDQNPDIRDVGEHLGADYVVEGSLRPIAERIRFTVQVIETVSGSHIWAEQYDRPLDEFFDLQDEVSIGVAAAVGDAVFRKEYNAANKSRTGNLSAWVLTSRADVGFSQGDPTSETNVQLARQAIALDPDYALAHAVLARSLALISLNFEWPNLATARPDVIGYREEAIAEANLAASLAPDDPKVLAFQAITLLWTGNPEEALSVAERVTQICPSYAEGLVYYADVLLHNGRSEESIPIFDKAISLTPHAPQLGFFLFLRGEAFIHHGDFAAAERDLLTAQRVYGADNEVFLLYLAGAKLMLGKTDEASALVERAAASRTLSISDQDRKLAFYTVDDGGDYFKSVWDGLQAL
jgi:TolB-like protein/Flp pilus assembly protein TadD